MEHLLGGAREGEKGPERRRRIGREERFGNGYWTLEVSSPRYRWNVDSCVKRMLAGRSCVLKACTATNAQLEGISRRTLQAQLWGRGNSGVTTVLSVSGAAGPKQISLSFDLVRAVDKFRALCSQQPQS